LNLYKKKGLTEFHTTTPST